MTDKFGYINSDIDYNKQNFDIVILGPTLAHSECGIKRFNLSEIFRNNGFQLYPLIPLEQEFYQIMQII